jgi:hypothetical protein
VVSLCVESALKRKKAGYPEGHPALTLSDRRSYQIKRAPIRPVRGPRIAVGCWNVKPAVVMMVSAACVRRVGRRGRAHLRRCQAYGLLDAQVDTLMLS